MIYMIYMIQIVFCPRCELFDKLFHFAVCHSTACSNERLKRGLLLPTHSRQEENKESQEGEATHEV